MTDDNRPIPFPQLGGEYPKIQTVFERDPATNFKTLLPSYALPEFAYLAKNEWVFTEKVDGTNIRLTRKDGQPVIGGRTDNAQIPTYLLPRLRELVDRLCASDLADMTLYGEGFGAKIQKGGGNYIPNGTDFVLFDIMCGGFWLERANVEDVAQKLDIPVVPIVGFGTLHDAIEQTKAGMTSTWGPFVMEGLVMRPAVELVNRRGDRIISKIKHRDFAAARAEAAA